MDKLVTLFGLLVVFILMVLVFGLIGGFCVMVMWNWLIPSIFHLRPITYWEGWGLVVLCSFLFKSASASAEKKA